VSAKEIEMHVAHLPFLIMPSHAARNLLGAALPNVAVLALRAILSHRKGLEVAHQQIRYRKQDLVFSSRIGARGDLIIELDIGDPRLSNRLVMEEDLRRSQRQTWSKDATSQVPHRKLRCVQREIPPDADSLPSSGTVRLKAGDDGSERGARARQP
jgi:hypothetical protein